VHWVRVDRISGKRVLDGMPGSDPKSSIIWEAFKAESEARAGPSSEALSAQRDALVNAIRKGSSRKNTPAAQDGTPDAAVEPKPAPTIAPDAAVGAQ
jgi:penicillin-binding protein 1A